MQVEAVFPGRLSPHPAVPEGLLPADLELQGRYKGTPAAWVRGGYGESS